jgi:cell division protein FtsL
VPLRTRLLVAGAGSLAGWMLLAVAVQHFRTYTLVREAARLERHRDDLVLGNAALRVEIQRLRTDDRYIERLAREQLGMLRPGEMELVVIPTADQHPTGQDPTNARARQHGEGPRSIESLAHEVVRSVLAFLENMLGPRPPGTR